ncbi:disulfide bond formation protein B [Burkholderia sp. Ac-20344]|uniref:disulfide bond formation protein B n=1 Tax=Burkholderia sp. Ac-20344 TaxID=2703890 RepID=UPI00197B4D51|nr:disulfide bond formation protein B [Burkholderia sp. Ac-20344]MBN3836258.1 disulfide bond formation protein B [Burkholderia sp. Ac-20344]
MNTRTRGKDNYFARLSNFSLDALGLIGISSALLFALYYQLAFGELPCPLCLLQRACLILVGIGFAMNVNYGVRNTHYACVLVSAVAIGVVAGRQVLLHVVPGTGSYGATLWGLHFYTWCFIAAVVIILFVAASLALCVDGKRRPSSAKSMWARFAIGIFVFTIFANLIATLLECGGGECASDPVTYKLLSSTRADPL